MDRVLNKSLRFLGSKDSRLSTVDQCSAISTEIIGVPTEAVVRSRKDKVAKDLSCSAGKALKRGKERIGSGPDIRTMMEMKLSRCGITAPLTDSVSPVRTDAGRGSGGFVRPPTPRRGWNYITDVRPDQPSNVNLSVSGSQSLLVHFTAPTRSNGYDVTAYKVEWSHVANFNPVVGSATIEDPRERCFEIDELEQGRLYYVRVSAGNPVHGFGRPAHSNPPYAVPSNWKEVESIESRWTGKRQLLDNLFTSLNETTKQGSELLADASPSNKFKVRKTLRNLFTSAPKFQKNFKGGLYMASVLHLDGRILVTADDMLPIVEIDSDYSMAAVQANMQWMMKVSCMWHDVKSLQAEVTKSTVNSASRQFRSRLLAAVLQLQAALGTHDLGQISYRPIRDPDTGSLIVVSVRSLSDVMQVGTGHGVHWTTLSKLQRRAGSDLVVQGVAEEEEEKREKNEKIEGDEEDEAQNGVKPSSELEPILDGAHQLISLTRDVIAFQYLSCLKLPKGLYLGYLKLSSSLEQISIRTHKHQPNVLPNVKVRSNNNVSSEEWDWICNLRAPCDTNTDDDKRSNKQQQQPTSAQLLFHSQIVAACAQLFNELGVSKSAEVGHRLYQLEVIELNNEVSFIVVLPPADDVCIVPGHSRTTDDSRLLLPKVPFTTLPVQVFEMLHQRTYQPDLIRRYSQLSCHLDARINSAQQQLRLAFSTDDVTACKQRVSICLDQQNRLDDAYRSVRWLLDVIKASRDKNVYCGPNISTLYSVMTSASSASPGSRSDVTVWCKPTVLDCRDVSLGKCSRRGEDVLRRSESSKVVNSLHGNRDVWLTGIATLV